MFALSSIALKKKLVAAFVAVASVACVVGAIAWWNLAVLRGKIDEVASTHVPGIRCLGDIRLSTETFKTARRAMLNANIDRDDYRKMVDRTAAAQKTCETAMQSFATLNKTPEQAALWNDFQATWSEWRTSNDEFFRMAGGYAALLDPCVSPSVPNPSRFLDTSLAAVDAARVVDVELRKQIKAWKNILLRGDNPQEFAKYTAEFDGYAPIIHAKIDFLKKIGPTIGVDPKPILDAESAYASMVDKYQTALRELKSRDAESFRKLDQQIRKVDQPVADALNSLITAVSEKATRIQELPASLWQFGQKTCIPQEQKAMAALTKLIENNVAQSDDGLKAAENAYHSGILMLAAGTITGFVVAVVLGVVIAVSISRPLSSCVGLAEAMAAGDLTGKLEINRKDEIGQLVAAMNTMGDKLRQMFGKIVENTASLAGSAGELSSTAAQLAAGAEETTNQSNAVAAAAEEMSVNMNSVAASTEQMSANVRVVASSIEELTASITEIARSAEQAAEAATTSARLAGEGNDRVSELGAAANEIGKVIEVIQDIAEQTSLLALNATIEAARAGDAGKGFAVVATEVKELSKQTAAATEDIRRRIEGIQATTGHAVHSIVEIADSIKRVNEVSRTIASAVEEQSITTREIARNVTETSTAADTVARGVAESATVTREIAKNIVQVDLAARQTAEGAATAQTVGAEFSQVAGELASVVAQFKVNNKRFDASPIKSAHALWAAKLSDLLAGRIALQASEVAKHTECKFGKWYYGDEGRTLAAVLPTFRTIGDEHSRFHDLARQIVDLYNGGQKAEAAQRLTEVRALSHTLCQLLDQLEREANGESAAGPTAGRTGQGASVSSVRGGAVQPSHKLLGHVNTGA